MGAASNQSDDEPISLQIKPGSESSKLRELGNSQIKAKSNNGETAFITQAETDFVNNELSNVKV